MKTALSSRSDRRDEIRYSFFGEFPAKMIHGATLQELPFLPVDISRKGLGLLITPCPAEGSLIRFDFDDGLHPSLHFICRHVHEVMDEQLNGLETMRRCGLELAENQQDKFDLIDFFAKFDSVMIGD